MRRQRITAAFRSLAWRSDKFREGVLALAANTGLTLVLAYLATTPLPKAERGQISKTPAVWTFQQIGAPAVGVDFDRRLNRTVNGECCTGYYETAIDRSTTEGGESSDFSLLLTGTTGLSRVEVDGSNWPISGRESTQIVGPLIPILATSDAAPRGHNISVRVHISSPKTVWAGFWDSPPVFGPASELRPLRDHLIFYRQQLPLLTSFAFLIIGILSLWLSLRISNSEVTLSFAELSVAMIGFALFYLALSGQIRQTFPVAGATIHTATRGVAFLGMARFLMRLSGRKSALRRLTAIAVVGIVAQFIGGYHDLMSLVVAPAYVSVAILTWATWCFATTATLQKSWGIIAGTATVHCLIATADLIKYTLRALGTDFGFQYLERYHSPSLLIMALVFILTAFVEAAKASTTLEARKRIADQVAHDIRSPIAAINAVAKGDQPIDQEARELLKSSIDRVRQIANELSGHTATHAPSDLRLALTSLFREKATEYSDAPEVVLDLNNQIPGGVIVPKLFVNELTRAISNCVNNGIEAYPGLSTKPRVKAVSIDASLDNTLLRIIVRDNGVGIGPALQHRLQSEERVSTKAGEGRGLGLRQIRDFCRKHKGSLVITSDELGTAVQITATVTSHFTPST